MPPQNIEVEIRARADQLSQQVSAASREIEGLGTASDRAAQSMQTNLARAGTALVALGAAAMATGTRAVGLGNEFDRNMSRIEGLVGIARAEVDSMRGSVMRLAGETATAPQELSNALFTITSAGLRGTTAMEALEVAARGSAAGMGDTRSVAQALTGILNAYAASGISAGEAGDFLAGTARAGNFAVEDLAGSLGRVLPLASSAGVQLSDVGGAVALLTRNGSSASEAVTGLNALLTALVTPTAEAASTMEELGLSSDQVRQVLQEEGLVAALALLDEAAGGNIDTFSTLTGGVRGTGAALTIVNADAETIEGTFGLVANSAGVLDEAFEATAATADFQMRQAMVDIQVALTEIGSVIAQIVVPALQRAAQFVGLAASAFLALPEPVQSVVVGFGALAAPLGAALLLLSRFAPVVVTIVSRLSMAASAAVSFGAAMGISMPHVLAAVAVIGALTMTFLRYRQRQQEAEARARALTEAIQDQAGSVPNLTERLSEMADELQRMANESEDTSAAIGDVGAETSAFLAQLAERPEAADLFDELNLSVADLLPVLQSGTSDFSALRSAARNAAMGGGTVADVYERVRDRLDLATMANGDLIGSLIDSAEAAGAPIGSFVRLVSALDESADAYGRVTEEQRELAIDEVRRLEQLGGLTAAQAEDARAAINSADNYSELASALTPLVDSMGDVEGASGDTAAGIDGMGAEAEAAATELQMAVDAGLAWADAARDGAAGGDMLEATLSRVESIARDVDALLNSMSGAQQSVDSATMGTARAFDRLADAFGESEGEAQALGNRLGENQLLATSAGQQALQAARDTASAIQTETLARASNGEAIGDVTARQDELTDSLRAQLTELGFHPALIERIIDDYALVPDEVLTEMVAQTAEAQAAADEIIAAMVEYGALNPVALLAADDELSQIAVREALLAVTGFDSAQAVAALDADASTFDIEFAAAVLSLAGFDDTSVAATLSGDPTTLRTALADAGRRVGLFDRSSGTATLSADGRPAERALTGVDRSLQRYGSSMHTSRIDANPAPAERALTGVDRNLQRYATTTATARLDANPTRADNALSGVDRRLERYASSTRTATIGARADGDALSTTRTRIDNVATPATRRLAPIAATVELSAASTARSTLSNIASNGGRGRNAAITAVAYTAVAENALNWTARNRTATITAVTVGARANGGIDFASFAGGGTRTDHGPPRIVPAGANVTLFGEPETGGEAFIPLGPQKRGSAVPVLAETASRMGFGLVAMANGGIDARVADPTGAGVPRSARGGGGVAVHQHNETTITTVPERLVPSLQRTLRTNRARATGPTRESILSR